VPHGVVATAYGITGSVRQWFQSYLVSRRQVVRTGSSTSSPALILCGIHRGSVLGPILFLLCTADLLLLIEGHGLCPHLYADDTQVYGLCRPSATLELQNSISTCIDDVARWMRSNRLQLNTAKTEVLHPVDVSICYPCHPSEWVPTKSCPFPLSATSASTWCVDEVACLKDSSCLFCNSVSTVEYSTLSSTLRSTVTGLVSCSAAVGLW